MDERLNSIQGQEQAAERIMTQIAPRTMAARAALPQRTEPGVVVISGDGIFYLENSATGEYSPTPNIVLGDITFGSTQEREEARGPGAGGARSLPGESPLDRLIETRRLQREGQDAAMPMDYTSPHILTVQRGDPPSYVHSTFEEVSRGDTQRDQIQTHSEITAKKKKLEAISSEDPTLKVSVETHKRYLDIVKSMTDNIAKASRRRGKEERDLLYKIDNLKQDVFAKQYQLSAMKASRLKLLHAKRALKAGISKEFNPSMDLNWVDKYDSITLENDKLYFFTKEIVIQYGVFHPSGECFEYVSIPIGKFSGTIPLSNPQNTRIQNRTKKFLDRYDHPHILNGKLCFGEFDLMSIVGDYDICSTLPHIIMYLETYNNDSPYMNLLQGWGKYIQKEDTICSYSKLFRYAKEGRNPRLVSSHKYCPVCDIVTSQHSPICALGAPADYVRNFVSYGGIASEEIVKFIQESPDDKAAFDKILKKYDSANASAHILSLVKNVTLKIRNAKASTPIGAK